MDAVSLSLLKGSTIDYATEFISSSFRIVDIRKLKEVAVGAGSWRQRFSVSRDGCTVRFCLSGELILNEACRSINLCLISGYNVSDRHA